MIFNILLLVTIFLINIDGLSTNQLILKNKKRINQQKYQYKVMNLELSKTIQSILKFHKSNTKFEKEIKVIQKKIYHKHKRIKILSSKMKKIQIQFTKVEKEINITKNSLLSIYTNDLAILLIIKRLKKSTIERIILEEIYHIESQQNIIKIEKFTKKIFKLKKNKSILSNQLSKLNKEVNKFNKDKQKLLSKTKKYNQNIYTLTKKKKKYMKKLKKIDLEQKNLRKVLSRLNIKKDRSFSKLINNKSNLLFFKKKNIGSYNDKKTISPVRNPVIIKKFGLYKEPIYNIVTFNQNIVFKISRKDTKVRNILDGKIVFINQKGMLSKVLIIAHANNIHTIYAKISRIDSSLYLGKKIYKGDLIGVVNNKLLFEVTKNKKNINPENLINI